MDNEQQSNESSDVQEKAVEIPSVSYMEDSKDNTLDADNSYCKFWIIDRIIILF